MSVVIPPIPSELFTKFNRIKFYDDVHKYYLGDENFISVTTILHHYQEPFDEQYWSKIKAIEYGKTQQEVLDMWKFDNLKATTKGSIIHNYAENLFQNKKYKYPADWVIKTMGVDVVREEYEKVKVFVDNFYRDTFERLIPIKLEFVMFDEEWKVAGMMDCLFYNVKKQAFQIWDYKTNKELARESKYKKKLKFPFSDMDDCEYSIYTLQLSFYKKILERNTSIKIDGMYLVWLNEVNDNYKVIEVPDAGKKIEMIFAF